MEMLDLEEKLSGIKRWKLGIKTAIHKPLLILYVLNQYKNGHQRLFNFQYEVYDQLKFLLEIYGQKIKSQRPEYPFWRLQKDGFWEVKLQGNIVLTSSGDAPKKQLFETKAEGGFKTSFYDKLINNKPAIDLLSISLIKDYFPHSLHNSLIQYFELNLTSISTNKACENAPVPQYYSEIIEGLCSEFEV
ncbi:hypothetical protein [Psychromonas marina]|nr:hypothetical protein [Psychromonas marina]